MSQTFDESSAGATGTADTADELEISISQARDAALAAGINPDGISGSDDDTRSNASYAFDLEGVKDGPQLGSA